MQVAVVTAVHAAYGHFLPAAWQSLRAQTFSEWRWVVQVDGSLGEAHGQLLDCGALDDTRVSLDANGTHAGAAITRNVALGRTTAPLIQNLDADDELEPTALAELRTALRGCPDAGFAAGPARDLLLSGELREVPIPIPPGRAARGTLVDAWANHPAGRLPIHPAGVMWRRELLVALGGWAAFYGMEDTGLLIAAAATAVAVVVRCPTLRYRRHRAQTSTRSSGFRGGGRNSRLFVNAPRDCDGNRPGIRLSMRDIHENFLVFSYLRPRRTKKAIHPAAAIASTATIPTSENIASIC